MAKATRRRNVSKVWNPSLPATLGNPKKRSKKVATAKKSRRNPSTAAKAKPKTNPASKRKRGTPRAKSGMPRKSTRRKRNPATAKRTNLMQMKNPASGANISVGGILGTVVVLGVANGLVNKATANQSPIASAGIKIGAGFGLAKWGKKLPFLGAYAGLAGLVLIILGGQDLFNMYASPYLANVPLLGPMLVSATPATPSADMQGLVNYNSPGMAGLVNIPATSEYLT